MERAPKGLLDVERTRPAHVLSAGVGKSRAKRFTSAFGRLARRPKRIGAIRKLRETLVVYKRAFSCIFVNANARFGFLSAGRYYDTFVKALNARS